jgi:hypothetical protein
VAGDADPSTTGPATESPNDEHEAGTVAPDDPARVDAPAPSEGDMFDVNRRTIVISLGIAIGVNVLALAFLFVSWELLDWNVWTHPIFGIALVISSLVIFGGFLIAIRRARIAIGMGFILTFLLIFIWALSLPNLGDKASAGLAKDLLDEFKSIIATVIVFFFGTEAAINGAKIWAHSNDPNESRPLSEIDRDF